MGLRAYLARMTIGQAKSHGLDNATIHIMQIVDETVKSAPHDLNSISYKEK